MVLFQLAKAEDKPESVQAHTQYPFTTTLELQVDWAPIKHNLLSFPNFPKSQQGVTNQPSSRTASPSDFYSIKFGLGYFNLFGLNTRLDYSKRNSYILNLFPNQYPINEFLLRDFYIEIPYGNENHLFWFGRKTIEQNSFYLLNSQNPFDLVELQGIGTENNKLTTALSINKETIYTTGTDKNKQLIVNSSGVPTLFSKDNYVLTAHISGKFLLNNGNILNPHFSFRYYQDIYSEEQRGDIKINNTQNSSSFLIGGIFMRSMKDGTVGETTFWFESLPKNKIGKTLSQKFNYNEIERTPSNYSHNTIGIVDSSEFYIHKHFAIINEFYISNNNYSTYMPVLTPNQNKTELVKDGNKSAKSIYKISSVFHPVVIFTKKWNLAFDINFNYVDQKLLYDDVNSIVITPILKRAFDNKLKTKKFFYLSTSYGWYDWKIKLNNNQEPTDTLLITQAGISYQF